MRRRIDGLFVAVSYFHSSIALRRGESAVSSLTSKRLPSESVIDTVSEPLPIVRG